MDKLGGQPWRIWEGAMTTGLGIRFFRTADIVEIAARNGIDWLFLDFEHGAISNDAAATMSAGAAAAGIGAIIRVPQDQMQIATNLLRREASGVMVAHVDTVEEAKAAFGKLALTGPGPFFGVMLESPLAIENADALAALEEIDVLMIGVNDLSAELGITGSYGDARIVAAFETVIAACTRYGKTAGMGGIFDETLTDLYVGMGVRFVLIGGDFALLSAEAKHVAASLSR